MAPDLPFWPLGCVFSVALLTVAVHVCGQQLQQMHDDLSTIDFSSIHVRKGGVAAGVLAWPAGLPDSGLLFARTKLLWLAIATGAWRVQASTS
jgi:hypothetical protein